MPKILYLTIGKDKPSTRKRVLDSLPHIRRAGHRVDLLEFPSGAPGRAALLARLPFYDLVVLQKKLVNQAYFTMMAGTNSRIVYDFDDAVMFHEVERGEPLTGRFFQRFCGTVSACRGVIAGNSYLASFALAAREEGWGDRGVITLPTPVDTDVVRPKEYRDTGRVVVGWMGTKGNLLYLKTVLPALVDAFRNKPEAVLKVVSNAAPGITDVPCEYKMWSAEDESADLASFDIGLMPLVDDIWTRGKGGYKLLQYMAAGVASVASPVGINTEIIRHGTNGLLAPDIERWSDAISMLMADPALRERIGRSGRLTVEEDYSLAAYNRNLLAFLERFM